MKKKVGILSSIIIALTGCFVFALLFFKKTDPLEDMFIVHPANRVITNEFILNGDEADKSNLEDIDLNDEEQIRELTRKQYKQGESGEIIFVKEPDHNLD